MARLRLPPTVALLGIVAASLARAEPLAPQPLAPPAGDVLDQAVCHGDAAEYDATLAGELVLDRLFLDDGVEDAAEAHAAVAQELKYFWGYYRTHHGRPQGHGDPGGVRVVLGADEPVIDVTLANVAYGSDLVLDYTATGESMRITDPYTSRAVARGFTRRDDPGLRVTYVARFRVAACAPEPLGATATLPTPLPSDPWLMHWRVPARERRLVRYFEEQAVTNPCVDDDYADLPHPFYHWYDWYPERHGRDARGRPFDCRLLLHEGVDFFPRAVALSRREPAAARFRAARERLGHARAGEGATRPLRVTVLLGVLDHSFAHVDFAGLAGALGEGGADGHETADRDHSTASPGEAGPRATAPGEALASRVEAVLRAGVAPAERGTGKLLALLHDLSRVMAVGRYHAAVDGDFLRVDVAGRLARSGRAVALHAYVGLTDVFGPTPPTHHRILAEALAGDDVIVYAGHSGIGENFRLANLEARLGLSHAVFGERLRRAPFQLVAFLSCYSYMYFGRDLEAASRATGEAEAGAGRELVYTGTEYTKGDRGALAVLDLADRILAGAVETAGDRELRFFDDADFVVVKEAGAR